MKIHCLQHVPFEDIGSIHQWIASKSGSLTYTRFYANDSLPNIKDIDFLIIMGGPMSIQDEKEYPYLAAEKVFIKKAIDAKIPCIGICLGAQLIANTLGAAVYQNPIKEIGWFPISSTTEADKLGFPQIPFMVMHWHGDTFDIPEGADRIASSEVTLNQGFLYKNCAALQFHLELNEESMQKMIDHAGDELEISSSSHVQTAKNILKSKNHYAHNQKIITKILDYLLENTKEY